MPASDFAKNVAKWEALFGIHTKPAPSPSPVYPILADDETQRRAAHEDLGRRLASRDRTPEDVLEALDCGRVR